MRRLVKSFALKTDVATTPVVALSDYSKEFVVETDASHYGIGVVRMQDGRPILAQQHMGKWSHYLEIHFWCFEK